MFYSTTMGESVRLFENSLFRRFLYDIGIHPTTAFGSVAPSCHIFIIFALANVILVCFAMQPVWLYWSEMLTHANRKVWHILSTFCLSMLDATA
jgi:hypothetical protein